MLASLALALLVQEALPRSCDAAVVEPGAWCRTCDAAANGDSHGSHNVTEAWFCVRRFWTNGCCVRFEPGPG